MALSRDDMYVLSGEDLIRFVCHWQNRPLHTGNSDTWWWVDHHSSTSLAAELGVSDRTVVRWRAGGGVHLNDGERYAALLGVHPFDIWGPAYHEVVDRWLAIMESSVRKRSKYGLKLEVP